MARKVYTYNSITELRNHPEYLEFSKFPHIAATANLKFAIEEFYGEDIDHVIDVHHLQKAVTEEWNSNAAVLEQYMNLGTVIREMTGLVGNEKPLQEAFLKSRREVLNSIRSLVEADIYPEDFQPQTAEEKMFCAIWKKTEACDIETGKFRALMDKYYSDVAAFAEAICRFDKCFETDAIVLHGFYYITPLQERIFDLLERAGKTLVFLGNIDLAVDGVNEIWHKEFSPENGFPGIESWIEGVSERLPASEFGKVFEGKNGNVKPDNIRIIRYRNEAEFISDVRRITESGYSIFSTDIKKTETVLKEIYPEKFKKRHLLSYPVGQYFYILHSLWDRKSQSLNLTPDDIQKCLSSGWVVCDRKNGRDYTHAFEMIKPYFSDCRSVAEWENRILQYRDTAASLKELFEGHVTTQRPENALYHRLMANPFHNLSCFTLDEENVQVVFGMVERLIETAKSLFGNGSEIDIEKHFSKIQGIIRNGSEDAVLYDEEKAIVEELLQRLSNPHLAISKCLPEDISDAVMLIIGGGILDEETFEFVAADDEHFVRYLAQIETAPIVAHGKIHLCLCDENRLPGTPKKYSWPISSSMLENILSAIEGRRKQYLKDMITVTQDSVIANRYLFYSALQNMNVELSWIAEENGKTIAESPYLRILNKVFGCQIEKHDPMASLDDILKCSTVRAPILELYPSDMKAREMEYDVLLCPWKYVYGYMTDNLPAYRSDFHYRFVLSAIISAFSKASGISADSVAEHVLDCFPYLKNVEKRQIRDFRTTSFPIEDSDSIDDASYSGYRLLPHFINKGLIHEAGRLVEECNGQSVTVNLLSEKSNGYTVCLYCQYKDDCIHATREADEE